MPKTKAQRKAEHASNTKANWAEIAREEAKYQNEIHELNLREAMIVEEEPAMNSDGSQYVPSQSDETYYDDILSQILIFFIMYFGEKWHNLIKRSLSVLFFLKLYLISQLHKTKIY